MAAKHVLKVDLAKVWSTADGKGFIKTLAWGDEVEVLHTTATALAIRVVKFTELPDGSMQPQPASGFIRPSKSSGLTRCALPANAEKA